MLQNIDLPRAIDKETFKTQKAELDLKLGDLQRTAKSLDIATIIIFEGWSAAGKGTLINELILPLDPRSSWRRARCRSSRVAPASDV